jgi:hypothetical protein
MLFASTAQRKNLSPSFCVPSCVTRTRSVLRKAIQKGELSAQNDAGNDEDGFALAMPNDLFAYCVMEQRISQLAAMTIIRSFSIVQYIQAQLSLNGTTNTFIVASHR